MMMNIRRFALTLLLLSVTLAGAPIHSMRAGAQTRNTTGDNNVPAPETALGFKIGEDRKLAKWDQFLAYFGELAKASDRIKLDTLGKTTLGRPFVVATISSPENLKRLDEFKEIQRELADPRLTDRHGFDVSSRQSVACSPNDQPCLDGLKKIVDDAKQDYVRDLLE